MKVVKISGLSGYNFGDLLLSNCLTYLFKIRNIEIDELHIEPLSGSIHDITLKRKSFPKLVKFLRRNFFIYILLTVKTLLNFRYYSDIVKKYDKIFYGGGNLLNNGMGSNYLLIAYLLTIMSKKGQMNILFCGVGPFDFSYKYKLRYIQKKANSIIVRDEKSKTYFKNNSNVRVLIDPAILVSKIYEPKKFFSHTKIILFNIIDYQNINSVFFKNFSIEKYTESVFLISKQLSCIPILYVTTEADIKLNIEISNYYYKRFNETIKILEVKVIDDLLHIIDSVKYSLVHRMHAGIITTSYSVPTLFFPWQPKINGFVSLFLDYENVSNMTFKEINFNVKEIVERLLNYNLVKHRELVKFHQELLLSFDFSIE